MKRKRKQKAEKRSYGEGRDTVVSFRFSEKLISSITEEAKKRKISKNELVIQVLEKAVGKK
jgi:predicted HicB family RNase H-like nuclease